MEQKERESDNIELRSEKVRNIIGKVPPRLVTFGTVVITIIVLALAVAFYFIATATINSKEQVTPIVQKSESHQEKSVTTAAEKFHAEKL